MLLLSLFLACAADLEVNQDSTTEIVEVQQCATLKDHQICDFNAIDELGDPSFLSDLYGQPIVLDLSAGWCGPCVQAASAMQASADELPGVTFLTILIEDSTGAIPDENDIVAWRESHGITSEPVWGSSREILTSDMLELKDHLFLTGWPTFYFINSDGELQEYMRGYDEATIMQKAEMLD